MRGKHVFGFVVIYPEVDYTLILYDCFFFLGGGGGGGGGGSSIK